MSDASKRNMPGVGRSGLILVGTQPIPGKVKTRLGVASSLQSVDPELCPLTAQALAEVRPR